MPAGTPTNNMANFTPEPQDYSITHLLANTFGEVTANIFGSTAGGGLPDILVQPSPISIAPSCFLAR